MPTRDPRRTARGHFVLCLLLFAALLGMSVAAAAHVHTDSGVHDAQCALCMTCGHLVAVSAAIVLSLFVSAPEREWTAGAEPHWASRWLPPAQRVRPPPAI